MGWAVMTITLTVEDTVASLLQAWLDWGNTYAMFVSENQEFIELMLRTQGLLEKSKPEV
jgi:hypothetical protein